MGSTVHESPSESGMDCSENGSRAQRQGATLITIASARDAARTPVRVLWRNSFSPGRPPSGPVPARLLRELRIGAARGRDGAGRSPGLDAVPAEGSSALERGSIERTLGKRSARVGRPLPRGLANPGLLRSKRRLSGRERRRTAPKDGRSGSGRRRWLWAEKPRARDTSGSADASQCGAGLVPVEPLTPSHTRADHAQETVAIPAFAAWLQGSSTGF